MLCAVRLDARSPRVPLEGSEKGRVMKFVYSYKSHVTSPFQVFGNGLTVNWETVRVTSTNFRIQHAKHAIYSPGGVRTATTLDAFLCQLLDPRSLRPFPSEEGTP